MTEKKQQREEDEFSRRVRSERDSSQIAPLSPSAVRRPQFTSGTEHLAKLRWRCRRGMRELDVVLERYLDQRYACAPAAEQQAFEALLDLPDPQLFAYLMRRETPANSEWVDVIAKLAPFDP